MPNLKSFLIPAATGVITLAIGISLGSWHANRKHLEGFSTNEYFSVQHQIRVLDMIYDKEYDKVIHEMETRLNAEVLLFGPEPDKSRRLDNNSISTFLAIASHRAKHPFASSSQDTDQRVSKALLSIR